MKAVLFADSHLGTSAARIPGRLDDQASALTQIADLAIAERADAVLCGGDVFNGPQVPSSHYRIVQRHLCAPLAEAGIVTVACSGGPGGHDSAGNEGEDNAMAVLDNAPHFHVRTRPALVALPGLIVACIPWAAPGHVRASLNGNADSDATVAELVLRIAQSLHDEARDKYPGVPVVALMHWSLSGWSTPTGMATDEFKEPVIDTDRLEAVGFDAVLAGHIHSPGVVNANVVGGAPDRPILYAGSPLPLDHGEATCEHGVWLLDIEPGRVTAEFRPLTYRPFVTLDFDHELGDIETQLALAEYLGWDPAMTGAIVRARYTLTAEQASRVTKRDVEQALLAAGAWHATAEPDVIRESRVRAAGVTESVAPMDALESWLAVQDPQLDGALAEGVRNWTREALA